ncbi:hypothetical protein [Hymenobacter sp. BRD67]|uniref:hypothetical protein n=1 Tax=Hymenobacter sp. BRD67 TaxID=2675877 RepID=UPI00156520F6|nr:hypothetical protein [Hymenobacter sp. BRD67]QKG52990.1 hypothetical protein GKZ67_10730 [Hymenobacter sp. BRD67]
MKLYWLYLITTLLAGYCCFMAAHRHRFILAGVFGLSTILNFVIFWVRRKQV